MASSYSNLSAATVINSDRFPQQGGVPILRLLLTVQLEDPQMAYLVLRPDPLQFRAPFTYSTVSDQWRTRVNSEIKTLLCIRSGLLVVSGSRIWAQECHAFFFFFSINFCERTWVCPLWEWHQGICIPIRGQHQMFSPYFLLCLRRSFVHCCVPD